MFVCVGVYISLSDYIYIYICFYKNAKKHKKKNQRKSLLPGWRRRLPRHCSRCTERRPINPKPVCRDYVLRTSIDKMKDNGFKWQRKEADYANDIALMANIPGHAETLQHSLERAAAGICLQVNVDKTERMFFNQRGDISILNDSSLKLVDKFIYLGGSVLSTKKGINTRLAKAWTAICSLSVI